MISKREEDWGYGGPSHWDDSLSFETNSYANLSSKKNKYSHEEYKSSYSNSYSKLYKEKLKKETLKPYVSHSSSFSKSLPKKPSFMKKVIQGLFSLGDINSVETLKAQNDRLYKITSECKNIYL